MTAVIVIEIVIGLVVLVAAVRFAVRDARERGGSTMDQEVASPAPVAADAPQHAAAPETPQHLSEVGSTETS